MQEALLWSWVIRKLLPCEKAICVSHWWNIGVPTRNWAMESVWIVHNKAGLICVTHCAVKIKKPAKHHFKHDDLWRFGCQKNDAVASISSTGFQPGGCFCFSTGRVRFQYKISICHQIFVIYNFLWAFHANTIPTSLFQYDYAGAVTTGFDHFEKSAYDRRQ